VGNIQPQPPTCPREPPARITVSRRSASALLTVLACAPVLTRRLPFDLPPMSASSQSLGLAESQDLPSDEFKLEDPACAWIDLVECCKIPDLAERRQTVNKMIFLAKNSHWTMDKWIAFGTGYGSESESELDPFEPLHENECECEGCFYTRANDQETLAKNAAAEGLVDLEEEARTMVLPSVPTRKPDAIVKLARTCVTARQTLICPFCGANIPIGDVPDHRDTCPVLNP